MKSTDTLYVLVDVNTGMVMERSENSRKRLFWTEDLNYAQTFTDRRQVVNFLNKHPTKLYGVGEVVVTRKLT